jgi:hypothetical protein
MRRVEVMVKETKERGYITVDYPDSGSVLVCFNNRRPRIYDVRELRYWGEAGVDAPYLEDYL